MVSYNEWVGIVFDVADSKGAKNSFEKNASTLSVAAEIWGDRKSEIRPASESTAIAIAEDEISVA